MSSHRSFTPALQPYSVSSLENPVVQPREPFHSSNAYEEHAVLSTASTHDHGGSGPVRGHATGLHVSLTGWNLTDPSEFISWRITRPKCASTAELFGHLPSYAQCIQPSPRKEVDNDDEDDDDDYDEDTLTQDVLSPLKKRQRKKLRESAGVKPKASKKRIAGPSTLKPKTSLPPVGRMKCLWGGDCTVRMAFDYTLDTIKDWKNHIASHLAEPNEPSEGSAGRCQKVKMVTCSWGGCDTKVEKGYLFKHIVTHEVRFKLLCPRGCEVAIRDDNLERHLRSCRLET